MYKNLFIVHELFKRLIRYKFIIYDNKINSLFLLQKALKELRTLLTCYETELGSKPDILGVALSSRKNLCIHPMVSVY